MNDRSHITAGIIGGLLAAICCGALLLLLALGTAGVAAWFSKSLYVLIPALLIGFGLGALWLYRHRTASERGKS